MIVAILVYFPVVLVAVGLIAYFCNKRKKPYFFPRGQQVKTLLVLGSGGHTSELLSLADTLDVRRYTPRIYVSASSDGHSSKRAAKEDPQGIQEYVPRARHVGQSWLTTPWTTAVAALASLHIFLRHKPDLVLCTGPGTCVPFVLFAWLFNTLLCWEVKVVFVESVCRVKTLSLSAKLVAPLADHVLVQWPELADKFPRTRYLGRLT